MSAGVDVISAEQPGSYNNINFAIVRDLLPQLLGRPVRNRAAANALYSEWIRTEVLEPASAGPATCVSDDGKGLLMYPAVNGLSAQDHGRLVPSIPAACSPGGQTMTTSGVQAVLTAVVGGRLLSAGQRQMMDDGCLGWDCSLGTQTGYRGKNGSLEDGPATLLTWAGIVEGGLPVTVAVDANVPGGLEPTITAALTAATRSKQ